MKGKLKNILTNRWFKFTVAAIIWILWFVVWTGNLWLLLGLVVIFDIYITKFLYRLFWRRHKEQKANNLTYRKTAEWVEAIIFATVVATLIRIFFFEMYVIPSSSMEKTLLVGDYLCVSKVAYGPRMPNTPVAFPFVHHTMPFSTTKKSFSTIIQWPYHRLKGFGTVQRGDAVVFNFPAGDTVILEMQDRTYYDVLRSYQAAYGTTEGRRKLFEDYTVITRPVDKRENFIKRCVGLPGDTVSVVDRQLRIDGVPFRPIRNMQFDYYVSTSGMPLNQTTLQDMGVSLEDDSVYLARGFLPLTEAMRARLSAMRAVTDIRNKEPDEWDQPNIFPSDPHYSWNVDNFGPLWIPKKGATVPLNAMTIPLYRRIIGVYEGHKLEERGGQIIIDGQPATSYTFAMNYYFMMGDNRHNSADSRYWGFVPEDHVVGKASFVWLSLDRDRDWFSGKIRWHQMFNKID